MRPSLTAAVAWALAVMALSAGVADGQVRMTRDEALKAYFGDAAVQRKTAFLTDEQVETIRTRARAPVESKIVTYYSASRSGASVGTAFFETKTVRTMPATFVVVIDPDSSVRAVEILAFHEPEDYLPPERWLEQFHGKTLQDDLFLKRGIHNMAGSTLSAQAITDAVRRLLATYAVVVAPGVDG